MVSIVIKGCLLLQLRCQLLQIRAQIKAQTMRRVGIKRILVYKSHIFPQVRKPIRSVKQFLMVMDNSLDEMKSKKMAQLLDEDEIRKLKAQRDLLNEQINLQLRKYYRKYILPFESCPDYYFMLFEYAKQKMTYLEQMGLRLDKEEEPFYLQRRDINRIVNRLKRQRQPVAGFGGDNLTTDEDQTGVQNPTYQACTKQQEKLLFNIYKQLYPSEKLAVLNKYNEFYQQFLVSSDQISNYLLSQTISQIRPFIFCSPLELFQSQHHNMRMKQCEMLLVSDVKQRDKANVEFVKLLQLRKKQHVYLQTKYQLTAHQLQDHYRKQYYQLNKFRNFYSMLKT